MRVEMGKWLHRGLVGVSLMLVIASVVGLVACGLSPSLHGFTLGDKQHVNSLEFGLSGGAVSFIRYRTDEMSIIPDNTPYFHEFAGAMIAYGDGMPGFCGGSGLEVSAASLGFTTMPVVKWYGAWIPLWMVLVVTASHIAFVVLRMHRRRRRLPHACMSCAYDLTGNESGVCPECGMIVEIVLERQSAV